LITLLHARPGCNSHSNVYHNGVQLVQPVRVGHIVARVEQPELHGEYDSVGQLDESTERLLVFESLQMERQNVGQLLDLHPAEARGTINLRWSGRASEASIFDSRFLGLLQATTSIAEELVLLAQHLAGGKLPQTRGDGRVLLDIDGKVEERFVPRRGLAHRTTIRKLSAGTTCKQPATTPGLTVSHVRHLVSLVNNPSNN
jgi:hypothetical protein